jgi:DNA-binding beta-propeller fold protein YncE
VGIAADGHGHLFVADDLNETVRAIDLATRAVTTLAGRPTAPGNADGAGNGARFHYPMGIATDGLGDVFVADSYNHVVRWIDAPRAEVRTFLGGGDTFGVRLGPLPAQLARPSALALTPSGAVLVASENAILIAR